MDNFIDALLSEKTVKIDIDRNGSSGEFLRVQGSRTSLFSLPDQPKRNNRSRMVNTVLLFACSIQQTNVMTFVIHVIIA